MQGAKWIKVDTDMYENPKIKRIGALPNGDTYLVIWQMMMCLAGKLNTDGVFILCDKPYTPEDFAVEFNRPIDKINEAFELFEKYQMIDRDDGVISLSSWAEYQNTQGLEKIRSNKQEQDRLRKQRQRDRQKEEQCPADCLKQSDIPLASNIPVAQNNVTLLKRDSHAGVTQMSRSLSQSCHADVAQCHGGDIDKESNIDITSSSYPFAVTQGHVSKEEAEAARQYVASAGTAEEPSTAEAIVQLYHELCPSYPKLEGITNKRRETIESRLKQYGGDIGKFKRLFENAEGSSYLKGINTRQWSASFDWLISENNAVKVLEGLYSDKHGSNALTAKISADGPSYDIDEFVRLSVAKLNSQATG